MRSFVANDYGEACYSYHLRSCDDVRLKQALRLFKEAKRLNRDAILPYYNLYLLYMHEEKFEKARDELDGLRRLEPSWSDALLAGIASRADAASKRISRAPQDGDVKSEDVDVFSSLAEVAVRPDDNSWVFQDDLRRLVPHAWLWSSRRRTKRAVRWSVFAPWRRRSVRWDEEFDELHVQAVFKWALARLLHEKAQGKPLVRLRRSHAAAVLSCIERYFWPGNFTLLFTLLQLEERSERERPRLGARARRRNKDRKENLRALVTRWLAESPTSYWALELVVTDFVDFRNKRLRLFESNGRVPLLENAKKQLALDAGAPSSERLRAWIDEHLEAERPRASRGEPTTAVGGELEMR